jgi:hypothetical protein
MSNEHDQQVEVTSMEKCVKEGYYEVRTSVNFLKFNICLVKLRKITKKPQVRIVGVPAEIRTEDLQNTSTGHYRYTNLLSSKGKVKVKLSLCLTN